MMRVTKAAMIVYSVLLIGAMTFSATSQTVTVNWVVGSSYDISLAMDANCAQVYFVEGANQLIDPTVDGDENTMVGFGEAAGTNRCQGPGDAAMVVTNNGTSSETDLNASFDSITAGVFNKIFQADATTFCGADGNAGYEAVCSGTVTPTTCVTLSTTDQNIFYDLTSAGTVSFCLLADFESVAAGSTSGTLTINSGQVE